MKGRYTTSKKIKVLTSFSLPMTLTKMDVLLNQILSGSTLTRAIALQIKYGKIWFNMKLAEIYTPVLKEKSLTTLMWMLSVIRQSCQDTWSPQTYNSLSSCLTSRQASAWIHSQQRQRMQFGNLLHLSRPTPNSTCLFFETSKLKKLC
jgi:hypothetical protein